MLAIQREIFPSIKILITTAGEMARQLKMLAEKTDDLSSVPRTNMVEGENQLQQAVLWPPLHTPHTK